jgi:hypothetical protein
MQDTWGSHRTGRLCFCVRFRRALGRPRLLHAGLARRIKSYREVATSSQGGSRRGGVRNGMSAPASVDSGAALEAVECNGAMFN